MVVKRFYIFFFVAHLLLLLCGCNYNRNLEQIARVEQQVCDSAELALVTLDSVNRRTLIFPDNIARFSLLYAETQAKCQCDALDSASVNYAYHYYMRKGSPTQKLHVNFLKGYYYQLRGDNSGAMYYYTCCEEFVPQCDNNFLIGRLYSFMGDIYERNYNFAKGLDCFKLSYDYYSKTDFELHTYCAKSYIAYSLLNMNRSSEAEPLLLDCVEWAYQTKPRWQYDGFVHQLLFLYIHSEQYEKLRELLDSDYMSMYGDGSLKYVALACCADYDGKSGVAYDFLNQALSKCKNRAESSVVLYNLYRLNQRYGHYEEAIKHIVEYQKIDKSILLSKLSSHILDSTIDYYKRDLELTEARVKHNRLLIYIMVSFVVFGVVVAYLLYRNRYQRRVFELRENLAETLQHRKLLEAQCESMDKNIREKSQAIVELYNDKLEFINQIGDAVFSMPFNTQRNEVVVKKVDNLIGEFTCENFTKLEKIANDMHDNIIEKIREQIPDLPNDSIMLLCYIYVGFNTGAICFFMGLKTKSALYTRKNRVVNIINSSNAKDKESFLRLLR